MAIYTVLDLSKYNSVNNYASIAGAVDGVIIRAGYRGYGSSAPLTTDPKFEAHYAGLNGKTKLGIYWFSQAINENEAVAEANYVFNLIKNKTIHFPVYLDSEYSNSSHDGRADALSKSSRTAITVAFCERMKALGYRVGVYASDSWFSTNLDWNSLSNKGYSLWVAKYSSKPPQIVTKYDGWQYTSSGSCAGVSGNVDLSHFYNDVAGWSGTPSGGGTTEPIDINTLILDLPNNQFDYTGEAIHCPFGLKIGSGYLTPQVDFTYSYQNNINSGQATCNITGLGNYKGSRYFNFYINPIDVSGMVLTFDYDPTYDGNPHYAYNLKLYSSTFGYLTYDVDYAVGGYEGDVTNVGWVSFFVKGLYNDNGANFTGTKWGSYKINEATINSSMFSLAQSEYAYTGQEIRPEIITSLTLNKDFVVTYANNVNVGTATITITGVGNYTGKVVMNFKIGILDLSNYSASLSQNTYVFDPNNPECRPLMLIEGLTEGTDFEVSYQNNNKPGNATATATGINNYTGTKELTFSIITTDISTYQMNLSGENFNYSGDEIRPEITIYSPSEKLIENVDYQLIWYNNVNPGTASVVANGINAFSGQITKTFTINFVNVETLYAIYGYQTSIAPYLIDDGNFTVYADEVKSRELRENIDYEVTNITRTSKIDHDEVAYSIKGLAGYYGNCTFKFNVISEEEYQEMFSESISASISTSVSQSISASESQSISTSISESMSTSSSISESESISNYQSASTSVSISASISYSISESESISTYQSESTSASISNSISESISASESVSISESLSEIESISESESASIAYSEWISASTSMSIALSESESTEKFISESISVSESLSTAESISISLSESASIAASESTSSSISESISTSESISESTATSESMSISTSISESESMSESISNYQSESYSASISESISTSESVSTSISEYNSMSISESISESNWTSESMEMEDVEIWTYEGDFDFGEYVLVPEPGHDDDNTEIWTYDGDFDFGELAEPDPIVDPDSVAKEDYDYDIASAEKIDLLVDPDSVAREDYDYNKAAGDDSSGEDEGPEEGYPAGTKFTLRSTPIYSTYSIPSAFDIRDGDYFVYSSYVANKRIRMCTEYENAKKPAKSVGWCSMVDLWNLNKFAKGDIVYVTGKVYVDFNSRERYINMENETMYIREIRLNENTDVPYGLSFEETSAVVGWAAQTSLSRY